MMDERYRTSRRALLAATASVLLGGAAPATGRMGLTVAQTPVPGDRLPVVATFSVLGDLVARVGGDAVLVDIWTGRVLAVYYDLFW